MSATKAFYVARAAECAADAERTMLENVRARCLRSAAAWLAMADRLDRIETLRAGHTRGDDRAVPWPGHAQPRS